MKLIDQVYKVSKNDEISDLIQYASGFTNLASTSIILETINPIESRLSNDKATSSQNIDFHDKIKLDVFERQQNRCYENYSERLNGRGFW